MANEVRVALVGKTGSGRSKFGNMLLGKECFLSAVSAESVTEKCCIDSTIRGEKTIVVADTPGMFHTKMNLEYVQKELKKVIQNLSPGPNAFLYILRIARYSDEEQKTLETLIDLYGENFYKFCVVVIVTGNDDQNDKDMKQYVSELPTFYATLIGKCNGRLLLFNNESFDYNKLLSTVCSIAQGEFCPYYSIEMLQNSNSLSRRIYRLFYRSWMKNGKCQQYHLWQKRRGCLQCVLLFTVGVMLVFVTKLTVNKLVIEQPRRHVDFT